jgi:hypothetical protein
MYADTLASNAVSQKFWSDRFSASAASSIFCLSDTGSTKQILHFGSKDLFLHRKGWEANLHLEKYKLAGVLPRGIRSNLCKLKFQACDLSAEKRYLRAEVQYQLAHLIGFAHRPLLNFSLAERTASCSKSVPRRGCFPGS